MRNFTFGLRPPFLWRASELAELLEHLAAASLLFLANLAVKMTSAEESGTSSWYRVPTWSGNPAEWRQFRREMNWWMASLDEESCKKFNVAARWALRQYGVVRARCEEFDPQDLEGTKEEAMTDPDTGDKVIRVAADPFAGLKKLMTALEATVGKTALDRKGELRSLYYQEIKRSPGERISAFCTRFRTLAAELKREGIVTPEEELGWMLKERLGLDAIRKQLLETALAGRENYDVVESECLRLFRDLHSSDPLNKSRPFDKAPLLQRFLQSHDRHSSSSSYRPSTTASSTAPSSRSFRTQSSGSSRPPFKRFGQQPQPRQALIAEAPEEEGQMEAEDEELIPDDDGQGYSPENLTIEEVLQTEAELLAQELQELETEGCDPRVLEDLESGMEQAAESLLTMREARTKIAEVKKDRGYGKPGQPAPRSTKPHGNQVPRQKSTTKCFDCGEMGHWAGDAGCKAPGAGLARPKGKPKSQMTKQVRVTETLNTEHVAPEEPDDMGHEVMTVAAGDSWDRPLFEVLMQHHTDPKSTPRLAQDKRFVGACNRTCAGSSRLAFYLQALERAPSYIQNLIITTPENELFRFGNGGTQRSTVRYRLPMALGSTLVLVWVSIVPVPSLGLLLGRDFLSAIGAVLSFGRKLLRADLVGGELLELGQLAAGHFALPLQPRQWPRPDSQRWRKLGQDGIVELQLNSFDFWKKQLQLKMSHFEVPFESTSEAPHEHLVTEHAILAATSAGAQAMKVAQTRPSAPTTSSSTTFRDLAGSVDRNGSGPALRPDRERLHEGGAALAANASPPSRKGRLARTWLALVAVASSAAAVRALSVPQHQPYQTLARTSRIYDPPEAKGIDGQALAASSNPRTVSVHDQEPPGLGTIQEPCWPQLRLHGGQHVARNACGTRQQRPDGPIEAGCHSGSPTRSRGRYQAWREARHGALPHWPKGGPANVEGRPGETGFTPEHPRPDWNDCGRPQESLPPLGCRDRSKANSLEGKWIYQFNGKTCPRDVNGETFSSARDNWRKGQGISWSDRSRATGSPHHAGPQVPRDAEPSAPEHFDPAPSIAPARTYDFRSDGNRSNHGLRLDPGRDSTDEPRLLPGRLGVAPGQWNSSSRPVRPTLELETNPWRIHQAVKPGQAKMISDAWERHERDRRLVSLSAKEVNEVYEEQWHRAMDHFQNEIFVTTLTVGDEKSFQSHAMSENRLISKNPDLVENDRFPKTFVTEVYTNTERVAQTARKRGHRVGASMSLESGWNFLRPLDRKAARAVLKRESPFFLVLAFPCSFWSVLLNLNPPKNGTKMYEEAITLLQFALQLAKDQKSRGCHFVLENPQSSRAWTLEEMQRALEQLEARCVVFHQCRFRLKNQAGDLLRKATRIATSSDEVLSQLDGMKCLGNHPHGHIIGGKAVSEPAGHYPWALAKALVVGMEKQFEADFKRPHNILAIEDGEEAEDETALPIDMNLSDSDQESTEAVTGPKVSAAVKQALRRLHENTGHRSGRRLARALAITGAPPDIIHAARHLKCSICDERKIPKARRPATLPLPKDVGDQVHVDLFEIEDIGKKRFYVIHAIDYVSRLQFAEVLETKSSSMVERFFKTKWLPILGAPRVLIADQGKEFVSAEFEEFCSSWSIYLHHTAVQAPWQNGVCERGGAILKGILRSCIKAHSALGKDDVELCLQEAVSAYNSDINDAGVSPMQAAFGKQPRMHGDCLGDFGRRLSEHGLIDSRPSLARQVAMRETARLAMVRLHFSKGLRRAELARSRGPTAEHGLSPGDIVYFFRQTRFNNRTAASKKRLSLKRWHGPALLVALEGNVNGYVSFRGQLTKCAIEHLRPASSLEQVASEVWQDAIQEVIDAAYHDRQIPTTSSSTTTSAEPEAQGEPMTGVSLPVEPVPLSAVPEEAPADLPPLHPQEFVQALGNAQGGPISRGWSRHTSSLPDLGTSPFPEAVRAAFEQRRQSVSSAAPSASGESQASKRPAELDAERLREEALQPDPVAPTPAQPPDEVPDEASEALRVTHEVMEMEAYANVHPLRQIQIMAEQDRLNPLEARVRDHGTWRGNWPLPSRTEFKRRQMLKQLWPLGNDDAAQEVLAVLTARKEHVWSHMSDFEKKEFREAAAKGWSVWVENEAIEPLPDAEAARIRQKLKTEGESHRILVPRFVYVDKNDGLRTADRDLPLKANARLVVPGYQDISAYGLRCDAPTASRTSQHLLLTFAASMKWKLASADIKSAFMKGEEFGPNERILYLANVKTRAPDEPRLPFSEAGLCRVKKGVFGLADSPRRWYKRLCKSVQHHGWQLSALDSAMWFLWEGSKLEGILISHVDDLLLAGGPRAHHTLQLLGAELGFGSTSTGTITYCGKKIEQAEDFSVKVSMEEYHSNLQQVRINPLRKKNPEATLMPGEQRQLRALLGSLQWLVAQVRFDLQFQLSTLQGASQTIETLIRANALVRKAKLHADFALHFKPLDMKNAGILVVSDASLGNVTKSGSSHEAAIKKVYSQAAYFVLIADENLMSGREGKFTVLDARSHRLNRVCRSTFAAELLGIEEALDAGQYCRGVLGEAFGHPLDRKPFDLSTDSVPLLVVTDAKDAFDKSCSETPSYGSQKSLAFTISWIRSMLARCNTSMRWTATENMIVDSGTKELDPQHLHKILRDCKWCVQFSSQYVKQTSKSKKPMANSQQTGRVVRSDMGVPFESSSPLFGHVMKLSQSSGWHVLNEDLAVNVCRQARSYRTPEPRCSRTTHAFRSTFARFDSEHSVIWRQLEDSVDMRELQNPRSMLEEPVALLVTAFSRCPTPQMPQEKGMNCES